MADLSPAAQAVLDAYLNAPCGKPPETWIAAALRAVAEHLGEELEFYDAGVIDVEDLLTIAAELEGTND